MKKTVNTYISILCKTNYLKTIKDSHWYKMIKNTECFAPIRKDMDMDTYKFKFYTKSEGFNS